MSPNSNMFEQETILESWLASNLDEPCSTYKHNTHMPRYYSQFPCAPTNVCYSSPSSLLSLSPVLSVPSSMDTEMEPLPDLAAQVFGAYALPYTISGAVDNKGHIPRHLSVTPPGPNTSLEPAGDCSAADYCTSWSDGTFFSFQMDMHPDGQTAPAAVHSPIPWVDPFSSAPALPVVPEVPAALAAPVASIEHMASVEPLAPAELMVVVSGMENTQSLAGLSRYSSFGSMNKWMGITGNTELFRTRDQSSMSLESSNVAHQQQRQQQLQQQQRQQQQQQQQRQKQQQQRQQQQLQQQQKQQQNQQWQQQLDQRHIRNGQSRTPSPLRPQGRLAMDFCDSVASTDVATVTTTATCMNARKPFVCFDTKCAGIGFARLADLERHRRFVHGNGETPKFYCDYPDCSRHVKPFGRKDHFREHLRDNHHEDLVKNGSNTSTAGQPVTCGAYTSASALPNASYPSSTSPTALACPPAGKQATKDEMQTWLAGLPTDPTWWRCAKCLQRVQVEEQGYNCCNTTIEPIRKEVRLAQKAQIEAAY